MNTEPIKCLLEWMILRPKVYPALNKVLWGPIIHKHWFVYKIFATYFKPPYRPDPPPMQWSIPDETTELVIESPGACAQTAFHRYFCEWNPDVKVSGMTHSPSPVVYASNVGIPCIVLSRSVWDIALSMSNRFDLLTIPSALQRIYYFYKRLHEASRMENVHVYNFERITTNPSRVIYEVASKYNTDWNVGDDVLKKVRNTGKICAKSRKNV